MANQDTSRTSVHLVPRHRRWLWRLWTRLRACSLSRLRSPHLALSSATRCESCYRVQGLSSRPSGTYQLGCGPSTTRFLHHNLPALHQLPLSLLQLQQLQLQLLHHFQSRLRLQFRPQSSTRWGSAHHITATLLRWSRRSHRVLPVLASAAGVAAIHAIAATIADHSSTAIALGSDYVDYQRWRLPTPRHLRHLWLHARQR